MALPKPSDKAKKNAREEFSQEVRRTLQTSYAHIRSMEALVSFETLTFEEAADQEIERLSGSPASGRLSLKDRITRDAQQLRTIVEQLKKLPDEAFADVANPVNTTP